MDFAGMKRRELQALCKRHGLPAGGTNAALVARLDAALSDPAGAEGEEEDEVVGVAATKGCLKRSDRDSGEAKKVTFVLDEEAEARGRRLRPSQVFSSPVIAKATGRRKAGETLPVGSLDAEASGRGRRQRRRTEVGGDSADEGVAAEADAGARAPVRRSRRNSISAAEAEELEEAADVDRKRKRKSQENAEDVSAQVGVSARVTRRSSLSGPAVSAQVGVSGRETRRSSLSGLAVSAQVGVIGRVTRRSSLPGPAVLLPPAVEKKRGRGKAADCKNKLITEAQDLAAEASPAIVESAAQKSAKVEVLGRITRSRSVAAAVRSPTVIQNKRRRKTEDAQLYVEQPTVSALPSSDAPVARTLRNRIIEVNNRVVEETHNKVVENNMQHGKLATRRYQQIASSVEGEDVEVEKRPSIKEVKEPVRRSTRKSVVSVMHKKEEEEEDLITEKNPEAHVKRSMQKSAVPVQDIKDAGEEIQNVKVEDLKKQLVVKQPVRRSLRKSILPDMLESESGFLATETNAEVHVRQSLRKSVLPIMDNKENQDQRKMARSKDFQSGECEDEEKQQTVKEPMRRSRRSIATVVLEKQNKSLHEEKKSEIPMRRSTRKSIALHEEKKSEIPMRRSTRKSIALGAVEKGNMNHTEMGSKGIQIVNNDSYAVGSDALNEPVGIAQENRSTTTTPVLILEAEATINMGCTVLAEKIEQLDEEYPDVSPIDFRVGDPEEQNPLAGHERMSREENTSESGIKNLEDDTFTSLQTKDLQHDVDIRIKGIGKASEPTLPILDNKPEIRYDTIAEKNIQGADLGKCLSVGTKGNPLSTNLHSECAADGSILPVLNAAKECSSDGRDSSFGPKFLFAEDCKESYSGNVENTDTDVECGNKPSAYVTPSFYVGSDCGLEDENVQPIGYDADKKLDANQGVAQDEVVSVEESNDHIASNIDLKTKSKNELAGLHVESDCNIAEMNPRLVADNQQVDVQEGDLEKPSLCSVTPERKHECGLAEEAVLHSVKEKGYIFSSEQSPFGLQPLFLPENIEESMEYGALASATAHTENGADESENCHVKCAFEQTPVSEPVLHCETYEDSCLVSKNDEYVHSSHQNDAMTGPLKGCHDDGVSSILPSLLSDANHIKEVINSEELEGSTKLVHSEDHNASSKKVDTNVPADNAFGICAAVLSTSLHDPANNNDAVHYSSTLVESSFLEETIGCSNTQVLHQGRKDRCNEVREGKVASKHCTNGVIECATAKYIESGVVLHPSEEISNDGQLNFKLEGANVAEAPLNFNKDVSNILDIGSVVGTGGTIGNSSFCLATHDCKHEGALSEEAVHTLKNHAETYSSNPRELLIELQSLFSENVEESDPHDSLAFPCAESRVDESVDDEHRVKVHSSSNFAQLESTDLLDELNQGHKDHCNEHKEEQVASRHCTKDMMEVATAEDIDSGVISSNLKDGLLNPKLEGPKVNDSGFSCNNDISNTSDNESVVGIVGKGTPSGSSLPEDSPYKIAEIPVATPYCKREGVLFNEGVHAMKNIAGTCASDPRQLLMELQSFFSKGSIEKSDPHDGIAFQSADRGDEHTVCHVEKRIDTLVFSEPDTYQGPHQDLSRAEEKEACLPVFMQDDEREGFLKFSHMNDSVTSTHFDLSDDAHDGERDIIAEELLCNEKERRKFMPTSDGDILHENLHSNRCGVLDQHHKEEYHEHSEDQATSGFHAMPELATTGVIENGITLVQAAETSALVDEQFNPELEGDKVEKNSVFCEKDTSNILGTGSVMNTISLLPKDRHTVYCQGQELSNDLHALKSADEYVLCQVGSVFGSGIHELNGQKHINEIDCKLLGCDTEVLHQDIKEECNELNQDKVTPEVLEEDMSEAAPVEGMGSAIMLLPVAATSEVPGEQLTTRLESDEGPCETSGQECINESSSMQLTSVIEALDQDNVEYNENNEDQITLGIPASSMSEAAAIEVSEMEIAMAPAAGISTLPHEQSNTKLEGNKADEHGCSYDKFTFSLFDTELVNSKESNLHRDAHVDPSSEPNQQNDLFAPKPLKESTVIRNPSKQQAKRY